MKNAAQSSPTEALSTFMSEIVPLLGRHVPGKIIGKKPKNTSWG